MFVSLLNRDQQVLLMRSALAVAAIDNSIDDKEQRLLAMLESESTLIVGVQEARDLVLPSSLADEARSAFEATAVDSPARRGFIADVATMVTIDGRPNDEELALLRSLMEAVGVNASEEASFLDLGTRAGDLSRSANGLVSGNS